MKSPRGRHMSAGCSLICVMLAIGSVVFLTWALRELYFGIEEKKRDATSICMSVQRWYTQRNSSIACHTGALQLAQTLSLLMDISSALNETSATYWLCYGTLWGVLREKRLLDYDKDGDICTVDLSTTQVERIIKNIPGSIRYIKHFTSYQIWRDLAEVGITLYQTSYEANENTAERKIIRSGWDTPYVARSCKPEYFPERFIKTPLPYKLLNGVLFPVPREHAEVQMYIYPDDWHLIVKPPGCR